MDPEIVATVRKRMAKNSTQELVAAYSKRSGWYGEEAFEAMRQILVERGIQDASMDLKPRAGDERLVHDVGEFPGGETRSFWERRWPRFVLLFLHVGILAAACDVTPTGYHVQLGAYTGLIMVFTAYSGEADRYSGMMPISVPG